MRCASDDDSLLASDHAMDAGGFVQSRHWSEDGQFYRLVRTFTQHFSLSRT